MENMYFTLQIVNVVISIILFLFVLSITRQHVVSESNLLVQPDIEKAWASSSTLLFAIVTYCLLFITYNLVWFVPFIAFYHLFAMRGLAYTSKWEMVKEEEKMYTYVASLALAFVLSSHLW